MKRAKIRSILSSIVVLVSMIVVYKLFFKEEYSPQFTYIDRKTEISSSAIKITPQEDLYPPVLHSTEWEDPIPLGEQINTAGAEDSPFIPEDQDILLFFFTPNPNISFEDQIRDGVTGIYSSSKKDGEWTEAERVFLQDGGKLALDGCPFAIENDLWFCSAREGYTGLNWFKSELSVLTNKWKEPEEVVFDTDFEVGEFHIYGDTLFYHSSRGGGEGGLDIWSITQKDGEWGDPQNIQVVNTTADEGWPFITSDGNELWFTGEYKGTAAIYRSKKSGDVWGDPELILSQFAGEPTLDSDGNIYFVHHFYKDNQMIEADIYVAYRK